MALPPAPLSAVTPHGDTARDEGNAAATDRDEVKRYNRLRLVCTLADRAIDLGYLGAVAFAAAIPLEEALLHAGLSNPWIRLAALCSVVYFGHELLSFPLSFYSGYLLEKQFALTGLSIPRWLVRHAKRFALSYLFGLVLVLGLFAVIWWAGPPWWILAAILFFLVSIAAGQLLPVVVLPWFYKVEPLTNPELQQRLTRLANGSGLTIGGVYKIGLSEESVKANAMLAGLGRTRRVLLGDTLLDTFTPEEIEVVFAHELGHHVHGHLPRMLAIGGVYGLVAFWTCDQLLQAWIGQGYDPHHLPASAQPMIAFFLVCMASVLEPLQNAVSRHFERQCDRYALMRTRNPQAYRTMFQKLAAQNKDDPDPSPIEVFFLHDHPPICERLALADE